MASHEPVPQDMQDGTDEYSDDRVVVVAAAEVQQEDGDGLFVVRPSPPRRRDDHWRRSWWLQIVYQWSLAVLIGVSLRMTTFPMALLGADLSSLAGGSLFLVPFGCTKALSNVLVGWWSDRHRNSGGRRLPHAVGWMIGILLGLILLWIVHLASSSNRRHEEDNYDDDSRIWTRLVLANILLGAQQGMTWTTNIFMFLDIFGPHHRALASGISNSTGYLASALATFWAAALSPHQAFGVVLASSLTGLVISVGLLQDTSELVQREQEQQQYDTANNHHDDPDEERLPEESTHHQNGHAPSSSSRTSFWDVFLLTTWYHPSLSILCCAGLMTNFVTSFAWGMVLIWGKQQEALSAQQLARIGSVFTFSKAFSQIVMAHLSDWMNSRKRVLILGFAVTVVGLVVTARAGMPHDANDADDEDDESSSAPYFYLLTGGIGIGCGIGSVYCVITGALSDHSQPKERASVIGIYKLWRDLGYAVGGLLTGWLADLTGGNFVVTTLVVAGLVTVLIMGIVGIYKEANYRENNAAATSAVTGPARPRPPKFQELQTLATDGDMT